MSKPSAWVIAAVLLGNVALPAVPAAVASEDPQLVSNGSFEAPSLEAWEPVAGAVLSRTRGASFHASRALAVTSSGSAGSGARTEARHATTPGPHILTLAVKGTASTVGKVVRASITDLASGVETVSAPVHLQPWWQTVGVSAETTGAPLLFTVHEDGDSTLSPSGTWLPGDTFLIDAVSARAQGPVPVTTSGRQLLVDDEPFTMKGYVYMPASPGGFANALTWNANTAQCQSDAQLLRAGGVNTLRIWYQELTYTDDSYRQCMDAFHAAGVSLMWLIQPPSGFQVQEDTEAYVEAYWAHLQLAVERLMSHPATLGYNIGNEMKRTEPQSNGWFPQVDELARRTKEIDPLHVATTTINSVQFFGMAGPIGPNVAPNLDLWGFNHYGNANGFPDNLWQRIIDQDPTRPVWISEFGTDRYRCNQDFSSGIFNVFWLVVCGTGSGEDQAPQAAWNGAQWSDIAENLSGDDPDAAVVGGTLFMWSDVWWFSFPVFTGFATSPATHDVTGISGTNPVNGEPNNFVRSHFPDRHFSPEWIGSTLNLPLEAPGPRATSLSYDQMGALYTGEPGPSISPPHVAAVTACSVTLTWASDQATYPRVDYGRTLYIGTPDALSADNFLADHWIVGSDLNAAHSVTLTGLQPGQEYRAHVRSFDEAGRSGTQPPVEFTTELAPDDTCV